MATAQDNWPPDISTEKDDMPTVVITVVMTLVATIFIGLRLYGCVYLLRRRLYLEEWLSVINQIDLWVTAALVIYMYATTGAGRHWATLSAEEKTQAVLWNNILTGPLLLGLGLPKLTVVSLLTRVFKPGQLHQAILWSMAIICVINFAVAILLIWLISPDTPSGDTSHTAKGMVDSWAYVKFCYFAATFSSVVDLYFALYPGFVFRKLGWDTKKKAVLSGVMGLGICATVVSIYKIMTLSVFAFDDDFTFQLSKTIIPTVVEANTIMIAASISTLHPVYDQVRRKLKSCEVGILVHDDGKMRMDRVQHVCLPPEPNSDLHPEGASVHWSPEK
ncbi:hypothetical protein KVR01_013231 [Diaporthe batatas]|uniref:uncharacterized protein n=1 Tax=Diaporthe batatas TaxID=748121 RepID=UPI001D05AB55|nr:uncharacterized protein KVR01_013231 [Diaporthe batatas]KAG8157009.1 hypothetical protein KVR01_013231 [Diaporthe batatas]